MVGSKPQSVPDFLRQRLDAGTEGEVGVGLEGLDCGLNAVKRP